MNTAKSGICIAVAAVLALGSTLTSGQRPLVDGAERSAVKPASVEYLYPEQVTVPAGKATTVTLHFRIAPGLHINSHTPREDELIPTTLLIPEDSGVRLEGAVYPPGADFVLPLDAKTKLSVYSGEFTIKARIVATAGDHLVEARLHYQACDNNACMPPKIMTAAIDVLAK